MTAPEYSTPPTAAPVPTLGEPALDKPYYGIGFGGAVARFFKKYATFSGRASRSEYWWVYLFAGVIGAVLSALGQVTSVAAVAGVLSVVWTLGTLIPTLSIAVRRLHDTNKSGWFVLIPAVFSYGGQLMAIIAMNNYVGNSSASDSGTTGMILGGVAMIVVGFILAVVLYAGSSKPEGARFDK